MFYIENEKMQEVAALDNLEKIVDIFKRVHSIAHHGIKKMQPAINEAYYGIKASTVEVLVKDCMACVIINR